MTVETDRRNKFRKRPLSLVYVELASGNGGMMRDLCEEGFALRAMMPLHPGEITTFHFALDNKTRIEGEGRMIWVEEGGRVAGLEFTKIAPDALKHIQEWLQRAEEEPTREEEIPATAPADKTSTMEELRQEARTVAARPTTHKAEVTVFPSPPKAETLHPPREVPTPAELKKEIAEALRQATAGKAMESEGPPVTTAAPPPPAPPPPVPPPPVWTNPIPRLEPLPAIGDADFGRGQRKGGFTFGRAIVILLLIAMTAGGTVYRREAGLLLIQLGEKMSGTEASTNPQPPAMQSPALATQEPSVSPVDHATNSPAGTSEGTNSSSPSRDAVATSSSRPPYGSDPSAVLPVSPLIGGGNSDPSGDASAEPGQAEYVQAMQILRGKAGTVDHVEAARLLWIAVEKGNSNAEVALAELYRVGQGVARNCDQARVLLAASARKGNPEGVKHLQLFEQQGCE